MYIITKITDIILESSLCGGIIVKIGYSEMCGGYWLFIGITDCYITSLIMSAVRLKE